MSAQDCGGCRGLGKHSPRCTTQPGWFWRRMEDQATSLGDNIGANAPELANAAYSLAGSLAALAKREEE